MSNLSPWIGPGLATLTFFLFARGVVRRSQGKDFNPLLMLALVVVTLAVPWLQEETVLAQTYPFLEYRSTFLDRLTIELMNFGLGMGINSAYLMWKRESPKLFLVPGILALVLSAIVHFLATLIGGFSQGFNSEIRSLPTTVEVALEIGPDDCISELKDIFSTYNADYEQAFPDIDESENPDLANFYIVYVDSAYAPALIQDLKADHENVDVVERNMPYHTETPIAGAASPAASSAFNDPLAPQQWYAATLGYDAAGVLIGANRPKRAARLAIVDTGVDGVHEDIRDVFIGGPATGDKHGHGTHCAGLAAAVANNGVGMASLNLDGKLIQVQNFPALNSRGSGTPTSIAAAILAAATAGADVISMSLGGYSPNPPRAEVLAIRQARKMGVIVVVAAGNSSDDARNYAPANIEGVIAVAALNQQEAKADFSNTNTSLAMPISAPGVDMLSLQPGNGYVSYSGTSMATPLVAGLLAVMRAYNPSLSAQEAYNILKETGKRNTDVSLTGPMIQPEAALKRLLGQ